MPQLNILLELHAKEQNRLQSVLVGAIAPQPMGAMLQEV
jgi:hypothetical protein